MKKSPNTNKKSESHVKDIALLLAAPVITLLLIVSVIYIPRLLVHPKYDFIYSYCRGYDCSNDYVVGADGRLSVDVSQNTNYSSQYRSTSPPTLRYYDVKSDSSRPISPIEARRYALNSSSRSKDGYTVERNTATGGGILFWSSSRDDGWYIKKGTAGKPLQLTTDAQGYGEGITFLGWVE